MKKWFFSDMSRGNRNRKRVMLGWQRIRELEKAQTQARYPVYFTKTFFLLFVKAIMQPTKSKYDTNVTLHQYLEELEFTINISYLHSLHLITQSDKANECIRNNTYNFLWIKNILLEAHLLNYNVSWWGNKNHYKGKNHLVNNFFFSKQWQLFSLLS